LLAKRAKKEGFDMVSFQVSILIPNGRSSTLVSTNGAQISTTVDDAMTEAISNHRK
jgi:hypothetical protein